MLIFPEPRLSSAVRVENVDDLEQQSPSIAHADGIGAGDEMSWSETLTTIVLGFGRFID
jgi:hypothetical protein